MKILKSHKQNADLARLEKALDQILVPVNPRREFIEKLQAQLRSTAVSPRETTIRHQESSPETVTAIGLASIFSILMLAAAGFRTAVAILGLIGIASEFGKQLKAKKSAPVLRVS